jgi:hypothetical protein
VAVAVAAAVAVTVAAAVAVVTGIGSKTVETTESNWLIRVASGSLGCQSARGKGGIFDGVVMVVVTVLVAVIAVEESS